MRFAWKTRRFALRIGVLVSMTVLLGMMVNSYRTREAEMTEMRAQLEALNAEYYVQSMNGNAIRQQINRADTDAFIERVARREYGYMNPGEIHYQVINLPDGSLTVQDGSGVQ